MPPQPQNDQKKREVDMREFLNKVDFTQYEKPPLSLGAFKEVLIKAYSECRKAKHPDAFAPSRSRLERIYNDKLALHNDPKAGLGTPQGFTGPETMWKYDVKNKYHIEGTKVFVLVKAKGEDTWEEMIPLEEYFIIFSEGHDAANHHGRDATFAKAGGRGPSKNLVRALINRCGCNKRGREDKDDEVEERPAKRGAGVPTGIRAPLRSPSLRAPAPVFQVPAPAAALPLVFLASLSPFAPFAFNPASYPTAPYPATFYPAPSYPAASYPAASYPAASYPTASYPAASVEPTLISD